VSYDQLIMLAVALTRELALGGRRGTAILRARL